MFTLVYCILHYFVYYCRCVASGEEKLKFIVRRQQVSFLKLHKPEASNAALSAAACGLHVLHKGNAA